MTTNKSQIFKLLDGRGLGYIEYGDPKGKPLFFFHGWPGSRFSGEETDKAAKKLGVRIISTDRPGIGLSDFKEDRRLLDWPEDVTQLANFLKIKKFSVVGVSGGGPYAAVCAYKIPERIIKAGIVVGLAPIDIKGGLDGIAPLAKIGWENYHRFPFLRSLGTLFAEIEFSYFPLLGSLIAFPTKEDRVIFKESIKNKLTGDSGVKEAFRQGIKGPELELKIYTDAWGFDLKVIKANVYLWYGEKDKSVSMNMGTYYHSQIKGSKLFVDPDGGHLSRYNFEDKILKTLTK